MYLYLYLYMYQYQLVPYLTLPNLQSSYIPTYCMQEPPQQGIIHSFIHSSTPSLPPSRLPAWYICLYLYLCVRLPPCMSVYLSAYLSVCMYIHTYIHVPLHTHKRYISKVGTYQRYMYTCVLGYVVVSYFKNNICRSDRHKKTTRRTSVHPPCLSQLHSVNLCASQSKISLSNWRPKTTVCLAR